MPRYAVEQVFVLMNSSQEVAHKSTKRCPGLHEHWQIEGGVRAPTPEGGLQTVALSDYSGGYTPTWCHAVPSGVEKDLPIHDQPRDRGLEVAGGPAEGVHYYNISRKIK